MRTFTQVYATLRKKNSKQYVLLTACCFLSVLLITAFVCIMRSPTVLNVLPEGGDSRKQVDMIFVLAVLGCGVFTTYASGLFFRYKSRETGIFMALGASKRQLGKLLTTEVAAMSLLSCLAGAILGGPLAWLIWRLFRLLIVDTQEMGLLLDPQAFLYALVFSAFVIAMMFFMLFRFIRRTNIMDVVNETRKSEPIREIPRRYGWLGIVLMIAGFLLGYLTPVFCITVLHWFPPSAIGFITYLPAIIGLYMILLHTVANGWRGGKQRYKNIVSIGMMKFQGRQTVRNMIVLAVLTAGAYFAAVYTPMLYTRAMMGYDARKIDYAFHYRADQNMPSQEEIEQMAEEENVAITSYVSVPAAILGTDGEMRVENAEGVGTTYENVYTELLTSDVYLSESDFNRLTGMSLDIPAGRVATVLSMSGGIDILANAGVTLVTNMVTGETLSVTPLEGEIRNDEFFGRHVLNDADYETITAGLTDDWRETEVCFNVEDVESTYPFAKRLFYEIVDRSGPEVFDNWNPVEKMLAEERGEAYESSYSPDERDSSDFRLFWSYMPQFRVLDKADTLKTLAVYFMMFVFCSLVCFAAVFVIAYTRSITIVMNNAYVYDDLRRLGASNSYLKKTLRGQISKVFFVPIFTGTLMLSVFYSMILFFNSNGFAADELAGMGICLVLIMVVSALIYGLYRVTMRRIYEMVGVR